MKNLGFLLCFVAFLVEAAFAGEKTGEKDTFELETKNGKICGSFMTSRLGKRIYSFRGLRYAEPPVGQLRFKPAVPVAPWKDVFNATSEGPSCPQPGGILQSEDCLRLNVYTTALPSPCNIGPNAIEKKKKLRPVIVFFHPGGFFVGSGQSFNAGPEYLLDQEIVLVTVNSRLGSLGFLSTGDELAPGNVGFKDQVESLRWVKRNIEEFGGDSDRVTISGDSAGAWTVSLFLVSPMTSGLFHRAIEMSGSALYTENFPTNQLDVAKRQARFLNCSTDSTAQILACLRTKDAEEIANTLDKFYEWHEDPSIIWSPVVEPEFPGVERFLTAQPADLIAQGKFHRVPLIAGVTKDEFGALVYHFIEDLRNGNFDIVNDLNQNWTRIAPIILSYERDTPRSLRISREFRKFYFNDRPISLDNIYGFARILTDSIGFQIRRLIKLLAGAASKFAPSPIYYYEFSYQGRYSYFTWTETKKPVGVGHMDDMIYLFTLADFPTFEPSAPEIKTVERLTEIWGHFAKTGSPIPSSNNQNFANVTWIPFTNENGAYLQIGEELSMKKNLNEERINFWERQFPN